MVVLYHQANRRSVVTLYVWNMTATEDISNGKIWKWCWPFERYAHQESIWRKDDRRSSWKQIGPSTIRLASRCHELCNWLARFHRYSFERLGKSRKSQCSFAHFCRYWYRYGYPPSHINTLRHITIHWIELATWEDGEEVITGGYIYLVLRGGIKTLAI